LEQVGSLVVVTGRNAANPAKPSLLSSAGCSNKQGRPNGAWPLTASGGTERPASNCTSVVASRWMESIESGACTVFAPDVDGGEVMFSKVR
jgi:hypothetical protein